jgi:hypothetical protein
MEPSDPEVLTLIVSFLTRVAPDNMDSTFAFQSADNLRYGEFGRDRYEHVNVIFHQMPFVGIQVMWYLHTHLEWFNDLISLMKISYLSSFERTCSQGRNAQIAATAGSVSIYRVPQMCGAGHADALVIL